MIRYLNWVSDWNFLHSIWKFAFDVFISTENGVSNINWLFFWSILKPLKRFQGLKRIKFLYQTRKHGCVSLQFRALCLVSVSKLFAVSSQHCTALPSPCSGFSQHSFSSALTDCCWEMGECPWPLCGGATSILAQGVGGSIASCAEPNVTYRSGVGHTCFKSCNG